MADPFVAEIRIFGFYFAPTGWAVCSGQLMSISQNTALFALLGTMYGGDGKTTFGLPDFNGSVPMFWGQSKDGSEYFEGQQGGEDTVTLLNSQLPVHTHQMSGSNSLGDTPIPTDHTLARFANAYQDNTSQNLTTMAFQMVAPAGSSLPHNNMMPTLTLLFCIALQGVFPPRP